MEWNESLATGIPIVDEQHQSLFKQVDDLLDRSKADRVEQTLTFLGEYVVKHFGTEEMMQKASKYPKALAHKKMHEDFVAAFGDLKKEYEASGADMLIILKITKIAVDWLNQHIRGEDQDFGEFFKTAGHTKDFGHTKV